VQSLASPMPPRQGPQTRRPDIGVVYLVRSAGRCKIGVTTHVERRLRQLNGQQAAHPVELVATAEGMGYRELERSLHVYHHSARVHGEWFSLDDAAVALTLALMEAWQEAQDWWK
jgi:hypothetical protein